VLRCIESLLVYHMSIIRDWIRLVGFYLIWGMFDIVISYIKSTIWFKIVENESFEFFLFFFIFFRKLQFEKCKKSAFSNHRIWGTF
jgi:hypothetical protein